MIIKRVLLIISILLSTNLFSAVVRPLAGAPAVVVPAAASTVGANGTFFRSDITIFNVDTHDQAVSLQWLPQGASGTAIAPVLIGIGAQNVIRSDDFVLDDAAWHYGHDVTEFRCDSAQ